MEWALLVLVTNCSACLLVEFVGGTRRGLSLHRGLSHSEDAGPPRMVDFDSEEATGQSVERPRGPVLEQRPEAVMSSTLVPLQGLTSRRHQN